MGSYEKNLGFGIFEGVNKTKITTKVPGKLTSRDEKILVLPGMKIIDVNTYATWTEYLVELDIDITQLRCPECDNQLRVKDRPTVKYTDLNSFGKPVILSWRKHRMFCPDTSCTVTSHTLTHPIVASTRSRMTTRAAKWCVRQVGEGKTYSEIARELACDWHTVERAVDLYGNALLEADTDRIRDTRAIGLDETSFLSNRATKGKGTHYISTVCDVENSIVIDVIDGRKSANVIKELDKRPASWKAKIVYGTLDLSAVYRKVFKTVFPQAITVADPFHVIKLANLVLTHVRQRVQVETTGHRGRKGDHLWGIRKPLVMGKDKLSDATKQRIENALELGDPDGELSLAWRIKEQLRQYYKESDSDTAVELLDTIIDKCVDDTSPEEVKSLGHTLRQWKQPILNYQKAKISNGPTEGVNNSIKKIKRDGYGFKNFANYRLRILLAHGGVHWHLLDNLILE